jgi:hypothetical protein
LVMAYYDNASMLERHYELLRELPGKHRDHISLIVVDDCSPNAPAKPADLKGMSLQIYRLRKDVRWNQDTCRNIGVSHAETPWVLLTDMDHLVPRETWDVVLTRKLDPMTAYQFNRVSLPDLDAYKMHPNSWLMTKKIYDEVGGYDEAFAGLYGTDSDFRTRVRDKTNIVMLKEKLIRVPRHVIPDASTTTYLRKQPEDAPGIARVKRLREKDPNWRPLRGSFEYDRVYP